MMVLCYLKISKRPHRTCIPESYCGRHDLLLCNKIVNQLEKVDVFLYPMGAPRFRLLPVAPTYRLGESFEWACSKGISPGYRSRRHSSAEIRGKFVYFVWPLTRHNWQGNPGCLDVSWFSCTFARLFSGATKGNHCVASLLEFNSSRAYLLAPKLWRNTATQPWLLKASRVTNCTCCTPHDFFFLISFAHSHSHRKYQTGEAHNSPLRQRPRCGTKMLKRSHWTGILPHGIKRMWVVFQLAMQVFHIFYRQQFAEHVWR